TTRATTAWRWILMTAELLVVACAMSALMAERAARHPSGAFAVMGIAAVVAWVFLFLGSPFLVRSQRNSRLVHLGCRVILLKFTMTSTQRNYAQRTRPSHPGCNRAR